MSNKAYRLSKSTTEHYTSLEALRLGWGLDTFTSRTSDEEKLEKQQEKFLGTCKVCGELLFYVHGTNVLVCKNQKCTGFKVEKSDGTFYYLPILKMLDEKGFQIAKALFN